jgi:hypothetical protein
VASANLRWNFVGYWKSIVHELLGPSTPSELLPFGFHNCWQDCAPSNQLNAAVLRCEVGEAECASLELGVGKLRPQNVPTLTTYAMHVAECASSEYSQRPCSIYPALEQVNLAVNDAIWWHVFIFYFLFYFGWLPVKYRKVSPAKSKGWSKLKLGFTSYFIHSLCQISSHAYTRSQARCLALNLESINIPNRDPILPTYLTRSGQSTMEVPSWRKGTWLLIYDYDEKFESVIMSKNRNPNVRPRKALWGRKTTWSYNDVIREMIFYKITATHEIRASYKIRLSYKWSFSS